MTWLLDGNLLVALRIDTHVSHAAAQRWFTGHRRDRFATCPVTQGTLLRVHMRLALEGSVDAAWEALREINEHPRHEFWADNFSYLDVPHRLLQGPSQITDAGLAENWRAGARANSQHSTKRWSRCTATSQCWSRLRNSAGLSDDASAIAYADQNSCD
jgi:uncharacterized protein